MVNEMQDMKNRIHRLEDNLLRCKNIQEQIRMQGVLRRYRKRLQEITLKYQIGF